jgi:hypothetical protein
MAIDREDRHERARKLERISGIAMSAFKLSVFAVFVGTVLLLTLGEAIFGKAAEHMVGPLFFVCWIAAIASFAVSGVARFFLKIWGEDPRPRPRLLISAAVGWIGIPLALLIIGIAGFLSESPSPAPATQPHFQSHASLIFWLFLGVVVLFLPYVVRKQFRERSARVAFLAERADMSDDEFVTRLEVPPEGETFALGVRRAIADVMQVPPEKIHPDDSFEQMEKAGFAALDFNWLTMSEHLHLQPDLDAYKAGGFMHVDFRTPREYIKFHLEHPDLLKPVSEVT